MNLENQVVSLELSKRLRELGVKQESLFWWRLSGQMGWTVENDWFMRNTTAKGKAFCSAFTVAELGEMLPSSIRIPLSDTIIEERKKLGVFDEEDDSMETAWLSCEKTEDGEWVCFYGENNEHAIEIEDVTEADARAKMLVYLLKNKIITL